MEYLINGHAKRCPKEIDEQVDYLEKKKAELSQNGWNADKRSTIRVEVRSDDTVVIDVPAAATQMVADDVGDHVDQLQEIHLISRKGHSIIERRKDRAMFITVTSGDYIEAVPVEMIELNIMRILMKAYRDKQTY